jgi:hypothetical protein
VGREIIPIGEYISINAVPFRIIGMFQRYESEQDRKKRELEKDKPKEKTTGVARSRGWGGRGGRGGGGFVFGWKNNTIYIPLNTMWIKFRSAGGGGGTNTFADPRLSVLNVKVADIDLLEPALQQARNVMMHTHKGIEDFSFQTQENWSEQITTSDSQREDEWRLYLGHQSAGGRHRHHEHYAGEHHRAHSGNRHPQSDRRDLRGHLHSNPGRSVVIAVIGGVAGLAASFGW